MLKMKVLKREIVASSKFLNFIKVNYLNAKGQLSQWYGVSRTNNTPAVIIVATNSDGDKILITKEYRVLINGYEWGFPAGLMDARETPEDTAIRELKEETGLTVSRVKHISPLVYSSVGLTDEASHIVYCVAEGDLSTDMLEDSEDISSQWMTKSDVVRLLNTDVSMSKVAYPILYSFVGECLS